MSLDSVFVQKTRPSVKVGDQVVIHSWGYGAKDRNEYNEDYIVTKIGRRYIAVALPEGVQPRVGFYHAYEFDVETGVPRKGFPRTADWYTKEAFAGIKARNNANSALDQLKSMTKSMSAERATALVKVLTEFLETDDG